MRAAFHRASCHAPMRLRTIRTLAVLASVWLLGAGAAGAQTLQRLDGRPLTPDGIDRTVKGLVQANHVTGLSVALIRDGRVAFLQSYGLRQVEQGLPMTPDTVIYGASLTKATFAWFVMQLVDEGRLDLDKPIGDYLPKPLPDYPKYASLAGDDRWRTLTFRILLDHTSGFANLAWIEPDKKIHIHRKPGARYGYSGEGMMLAQFVLEEGLHLDVGVEMQRRIFDRFGMAHTGMVWRDTLGTELADRYPAADPPMPHRRRPAVQAAGSMDTTARDWSAFLAAVVRGEGLSPRAKAEMIRRQLEIDSPTQFPTLSDARTDAYRPIQLGYGLGWGVFETPFGHAFFKEGHDDGAANYALCIEPKKACILLLSNSDRAEGIYKALVEALMGDVRLPWKWEGYAPYDGGGAGA